MNPFAQIGVIFSIGVVSWAAEHFLSSAGKAREAQAIGIAATVGVITMILFALRELISITRTVATWW